MTLSPFADDGSLLPFIREPELDERGWPAERLGEGDGGLQAYGFRVCLTDRAGRTGCRSSEPHGYDPARVRAARALPADASTVEARDLLGLVPDLLPNGKCDVNSIGPFSLNVLDGSNRDYPDGDDATRAACASTTSRYTQALLCYLATTTTCRRASATRSRAGACAPTSSPTPAAGRTSSTSATARRMLGEYVLREPICSTRRRSPTPSRSARTTSTSARSSARGATCPSTCATPAVFNEGYLSVPVPPYPIPYRSLVPRREDCDEPARAGLPLGVARRLRLGADGADADAARPRGRASRRRRRPAAASRCRTSTSRRSRTTCARGTGALAVSNAIALHDRELRRPRDRLRDARLGPRRPDDERGVRADRDVRGAARRAARRRPRRSASTRSTSGARTSSPDWATDEHVDDRASTRSRGTGCASRRTRRGSARRTSSARASWRSRSARDRSAAASRATPRRSRRCCASTACGSAIENHPEKTPAELLAKIARGDGDVRRDRRHGLVGDAGLRRRARDRGARRARAARPPEGRARRGRAARDVPLGRGHRADRGVRARARSGSATRARSPSSTSRRRSTRRDDVRAMRARARRLARVSVALVGAGNIAQRYARGSRTSRGSTLVGATDVAARRARRRSSRRTAARDYDSLEELLADDARRRPSST